MLHQHFGGGKKINAKYFKEVISGGGYVKKLRLAMKLSEEEVGDGKELMTWLKDVGQVGHSFPQISSLA